MSIRKNWRTTLLVLLITFTFTSVIGGTMAWFTDTVESNTNVIQSGTLDVGLNFVDHKEYKGLTDTKWNVIDPKDGTAPAAGPIFGKDILWEPGYTSLKYLQVVNNGNLAFKYQIQVVPTITPVKGETNLADVIDVYYCVVDLGTGAASNYAAPKSFADITASTEWVKLGTISELMSQPINTVNGVMLDDQKSATIAIALHMQETAGNEYQNLSIGNGFAIKLVATQYTHEDDSFNNLYDLDAGFVTNDYPMADVELLPVDPTTGKLIVHTMNEGDLALNTAYTFTAPHDEETVMSSPYWHWNADFEITINQDVPAGTAWIAGQYTTFSNDWFGVIANDNLKAGEPIRLLKDGGALLNGEPLYMNYKELCSLVKVFNCGAGVEDGTNEGLTLTVKLYLYETEEPYESGNPSPVEPEGGQKILIGTYSYTF